jgi:hypothetical protein
MHMFLVGNRGAQEKHENPSLGYRTFFSPGAKYGMAESVGMVRNRTKLDRL